MLLALLLIAPALRRMEPHAEGKATAERGGADPFLVVYALAGAIGVVGVLAAVRTRA